jgi:hypothetical protein
VPYGTLDLDPSRLVHPVALDDPYQNSACHVPLAPVTTLQFVSVFSFINRNRDASVFDPNHRGLPKGLRQRIANSDSEPSSRPQPPEDFVR